MFEGTSNIYLKESLLYCRNGKKKPEDLIAMNIFQMGILKAKVAKAPARPKRAVMQ